MLRWQINHFKSQSMVFRWHILKIPLTTWFSIFFPQFKRSNTCQWCHPISTNRTRRHWQASTTQLVHSFHMVFCIFSPPSNVLVYTTITTILQLFINLIYTSKTPFHLLTLLENTFPNEEIKQKHWITEFHIFCVCKKPHNPCASCSCVTMNLMARLTNFDMLWNISLYTYTNFLSQLLATWSGQNETKLMSIKHEQDLFAEHHTLQNALKKLSHISWSVHF